MTVEIKTFSGAVDEAINRSGRRDRTADIVSYVRSTLRECTVLKGNIFKSDHRELSLTVDASPFIWNLPTEFRQLLIVEYPYWTSRGDVIVPDEVPLGHRRDPSGYWFYRTIDSLVFNGIAVGDSTKIAYASYQKAVPYYEVANRPARFDLETDSWIYHANYTGSDTLNETARGLVTNWLLFRWFDLIVEGTLAKLYKTVGDPRSTSSYALYKQYQNDLLSGESLLVSNLSRLNHGA
jgi:hypothetical protein